MQMCKLRQVDGCNKLIVVVETAACSRAWLPNQGKATMTFLMGAFQNEPHSDCVL